MADIKISQLQEATEIKNEDFMMMIQNSINKKITITTLLSHLDRPVVVNSGKTNISFTVNGTNPYLIYTNPTTNSVGIGTNNPLDAKLHVNGNIRVGQTVEVERYVENIQVTGSSLSTKTITVTTMDGNGDSTPHSFLPGDLVRIIGCNISAINGLQTILVSDQNTFYFNIPSSVATDSLVTSPAGACVVTRTKYEPGVYVSSKEDVYVGIDSLSSITTLGASYGISALTIAGSCTFNVTSSGAPGQTKYIYLKTVGQLGARAELRDIKGLGFAKITLSKPGDAVSLMWDGDSWICTGVYGANVSTT